MSMYQHRRAVLPLQIISVHINGTIKVFLVVTFDTVRYVCKTLQFEIELSIFAISQ